MKKIFTLFVALVALSVCARAQVTIILEAHDVWEDGSGYQLLLDADHNTFGSVIPETGPLSTSGDVPSSVYAEFEYKVPENADGSLSTNNIVYDGSQTIQIPAGTYDFCVTNPTPGDKMWIASGENGRKDDYVFENGKTYHFLVALNGSNDGVTITSYTTPTGSSIILPTETLDFGSVSASGGNRTLTIDVLGYDLSSSITATATAPFTVSSNGSNFGATATIPQQGGTLYIRFAPTAVGAASSTIQFASGSVTSSLAVTGTGINCDNAMALPYFQGFEDGFACDILNDADGDGRNWMLASEWMAETEYPFEAYEGVEALISESWSDAYLEDYTPDNWWITPVLTIPDNGANLSWFVKAGLASYPSETYEVSVAVANSNSWTPVWSETLEAENADWSIRTVALSQFSGQNVKIAFRHFNSNDQYTMAIDNVSVTPGTGIENRDNSTLVYPNPASYIINVDANSGINHIEVFNINGQKINDIQVDGSTTAKINTSDLSNGLYIMKVYTENGVSNQKFSVVK